MFRSNQFVFVYISWKLKQLVLQKIWTNRNSMETSNGTNSFPFLDPPPWHEGDWSSCPVLVLMFYYGRLLRNCGASSDLNHESFKLQSKNFLHHLTFVQNLIFSCIFHFLFYFLCFKAGVKQGQHRTESVNRPKNKEEMKVWRGAPTRGRCTRSNTRPGQSLEWRRCRRSFPSGPQGQLQFMRLERESLIELHWLDGRVIGNNDTD